MVAVTSCSPAAKHSSTAASSTSVEQAARANANLYDCASVPPSQTCLSSYISTQGIRVDGVDITAGRQRFIEAVSFIDHADFADRMPQTLIVPTVRQMFAQTGKIFQESDWHISLEPPPTRNNFGQGFTIDLQGPISLQADIKNTGKFQITNLRSGDYTLRLYKEFTLTARQHSTQAHNRQCIVLESLRDIQITQDGPHQELGAITDFSFYYRPGNQSCDGRASEPGVAPTDSGDGFVQDLSAATATGSTAASTSTDSTNTATASAAGSSNTATASVASTDSTGTATASVASTSGTATDTSTLSTSNVTSTSTNTSVNTGPILTFSAVVHEYCGGSFKALVPNTSSNHSAWVLTQTARDIYAQALDANSELLDNLGPGTVLNGQNGACTNTAYTPALSLASANGVGVLALWNCTGDGVNRYWRGLVSANGSFAQSNQYLGGTLAYQACSYSPSILRSKCGAELLDHNLQVTTTTSMPASGTGLDAEIGITDGFASISGSTLRIYRHTDSTTCTATLAGPGMGLAESGDDIYAYNGRVLERIHRLDCQKATLATLRGGSDGFFVRAPVLLWRDGSLLAAGPTINSIHLDEIITAATTAALQRTQQIPLPQGSGTAYRLMHSTGSRLLTAIAGSNGCTQLRLSEVLDD